MVHVNKVPGQRRLRNKILVCAVAMKETIQTNLIRTRRKQGNLTSSSSAKCCSSFLLCCVAGASHVPPSSCAVAVGLTQSGCAHATSAVRSAVRRKGVQVMVSHRCQVW